MLVSQDDFQTKRVNSVARRSYRGTQSCVVRRERVCVCLCMKVMECVRMSLCVGERESENVCLCLHREQKRLCFFQCVRKVARPFDRRRDKCVSVCAAEKDGVLPLFPSYLRSLDLAAWVFPKCF